MESTESGNGIVMTVLTFPAIAALVAASYAVHGSIAVGVFLYDSVVGRYPLASRRALGPKN